MNSVVCLVLTAAALVNAGSEKLVREGCTPNAGPAPSCYSQRQHAATRCCSFDGSFCDSLCEFASVDYATAVELCANLGLRLCTDSELDSGVCCGTGCGFDGVRVWTTDDCCKEAQFVLDGCLTANTQVPPACVFDRDEFTAAVRCCSQDGTVCDSEPCVEDVDYSTAADLCAGRTIGGGPGRLCTANEISSGVCCGTGCGFDGNQIWTESLCESA